MAHRVNGAGSSPPLAALADRVQHAEHLQPAAEPERGRARAVDAGQDQRHAPRHLRFRADPLGGCSSRSRQQQGQKRRLSKLPDSIDAVFVLCCTLLL